jgi:hypothetical protein
VAGIFFLCFLLLQAPRLERLRDTLPQSTPRNGPAPGTLVALAAGVAPETVYVGQQATYAVSVYIADEARLRLRRNPQIVPGELRSMVAYDLAPLPPLQYSRGDGLHYEVHQFRRALFAIEPGRHRVAPSRLDYTLRTGSSLFSSEERHSEASAAAELVAVEPPNVGRPAGYRGAVGQLAVSLQASVQKTNAGVPFTVTVEVMGSGNIAMLPRPDLSVEAEAVLAGERVELDTSKVILSGRKAFDWVVTPGSPGRLVIQPVEYAYFDPYERRYAVAVSGAVMVEVAASPVAAAPLLDSGGGAGQLQPIRLRRVFRGALSHPITDRLAFWWALAVVPVIAMAAAAARRFGRRSVVSAQRSRNSSAVVRGQDAATLRRSCLAFLAARIASDAADAVELDVLERRLRRAGVSQRTAQGVVHALRRLEEAVFSGAAETPPGIFQELEQLLRAVDSEAVKVGRTFLPAAFLLATGASLALSSALWAARQEDAGQLFVQGIAAFDSGRYAEARQNFLSVGRTVPRSPDAWFNFGVASWILADTGGAVLGWQRSVRLEPLAGDARRALRALGPAGVLDPVPPLPPLLLAFLTALSWVAGWALLTFAPGSRVAGLFLIAFSLVAAAVTLLQKDILAGKDLAVVTRSGALRALPALGGDATGEVRAGAVVRVVSRQGEWFSVVAAGVRRGWLEGERLVAVPVE